MRGQVLVSRFLKPRRRIAWLENKLVKEPNIRIYVSHDCRNCSDRLALSAGTRTVEQDEIDRLGYSSDARLPLEPWRPITPVESELLLSKTIPRFSDNFISVLKLPPISDSKRDLIAQNDENTIRDQIVRPLTSVCHFGGPLHVIGVGIRPPNARTLTTDHWTGRRVGLHVDSWDGIDLCARSRATNRLCLNIGESDRFFLFLPYLFTEMVQILNAGMDDSQGKSFEQLFMEKYEMVPVIRCRLSPGEAYIAPTENLVHDASSEGGKSADVNFTIRGEIELLR